MNDSILFKVSVLCTIVPLVYKESIFVDSCAYHMFAMSCACAKHAPLLSFSSAYCLVTLCYPNMLFINTHILIIQKYCYSKGYITLPLMSMLMTTTRASSCQYTWCLTPDCICTNTPLHVFGHWNDPSLQTLLAFGDDSLLNLMKRRLCSTE